MWQSKGNYTGRRIEGEGRSRSFLMENKMLFHHLLHMSILVCKRNKNKQRSLLYGKAKVLLTGKLKLLAALSLSHGRTDCL